MTFHGMRNLASELDYRDGPKERPFDLGKPSVLQGYKEKISIGQPLDGIAELGVIDRQLLQSTEFYAINNVILRKETEYDELDQALVDVHWIPEKVRETLLLMDLEGLNSQSLLSVLSQVKDDPDALSFLEQNHLLWVSDSDQDALAQANDSLDTVNDSGLGNKEDTVSGEWEGSPFVGLLKDFLQTQETQVRVNKVFSPPRDRYRLADRHQFNPNSEAKERRHYDLKDNIAQIKDLRSVEGIEEHLAKLRKDYREDSILWREWGFQRKADDREIYLQSMRKQGLDMETIRAKLWAVFDREPETIKTETCEAAPLKSDWIYHYDPESGAVDPEYQMTPDEIHEQFKNHKGNPREVVTKFRVIKPCIWDIEKSKAFRNLHHTKAQWRKIYDHAWVALGEALLGRALIADTNEAKFFIRRKVAQWQHKLSAQTRREIATILAKKERL